jgi:hypothetical protein
VGINDYRILDPKHHELDKAFVFVLYIGQLETDRFKKLSDISQRAWNLPAPDPTAPEPVKKNWLDGLQQINKYILDKRDQEVFKKGDVPSILNLQDYLNEKLGQIVEVTLPDRRKLGIYPDNQRLLGDYDVEYHASTVINIAKLFQLFDASEIIIKEI